MLLPARPYFLLIGITILLIFYLSGPYSSRRAQRKSSNADARLMRWLETVSPAGAPFKTEHGYDSPVRQPGLGSRPLTAFDPFPLGRPTGLPQGFDAVQMPPGAAHDHPLQLDHDLHGHPLNSPPEATNHEDHEFNEVFWCFSKI